MLLKQKNVRLVIIGLIAALLLVFGRIAGNDFIGLDDHAYLSGNPFIQSGIHAASIQWAFTTTYFGYWHPVTWLLHMIDWTLFGSHAGGHHMVSLLLHIGSVLALFLFLYKTTGYLWRSAFAAALFGLHPCRVESVAWAAERKDVLSLFFGLTALYAYACYAESLRLSKYVLCFVLFVLALMSKPVMVTLPFAFLLVDYWPLNRWQRDARLPDRHPPVSAGRLIGEKIPFMVMAAVLSIVTLLTQTKTGAVPGIEQLSYGDRATNAIVSYGAYLGKFFWPRDFAVFYPLALPLPAGKILGIAVMLVAMSVFVLASLRKLPFLAVGWFWYLGTAIPLIGLVQSGSQAMADRHTYLPSIGIVIMAVWGIPLLWKNAGMRKAILLPSAAAVLAVMALLSWKQCGYWKDSHTLFSRALHVTNDNFLAHHSRGVASGQSGRYAEAIEDFNKAIGIKPDYYIAYNNRGLAHYNMGRLHQAIGDYSEAIRLRPDYLRAYQNRAVVYLTMGDTVRGCRDARRACELGDCGILDQAGRLGDCP